MFRMETVFNAQSRITPDFAAELAQCASHHTSEVYLECGDVRLCVDSLIGMLSMDLRSGMRVAISAEGADEERVVHALCELLSRGAERSQAI